MEKRFIFRGNAVGAAGHIHSPEDLIIWVQGASSLPVIGGYARSSTERMKFSDILSLEYSRTQSTGDWSEPEKAYKTLANSVVKGLNVNSRLTADSLEATLTSTHPDNGNEPSIVPMGTAIVNLRLDGYPVNVTVDTDLFTKYATKESLSRAYATDDAFFKKHGWRFSKSENDKPVAGKTRQVPEAGGYIVTTIVSEIQTKHPRAVVSGNVITLNGFGRIFLGELLITGVARRLTLIRLKLGSSDAGTKKSSVAAAASVLIEGDVACCEVESNGIIIF